MSEEKRRPHLRGERLQKRERLYREERSAHFIRAAIVGILAGLLAVSFQYSVSKAELLASTMATLARGAGFLGYLILLLITAGVGAVVSHLIGRYAPESGGSGIPHIKAALLHLRIIRPIRIIIAKFFGGVAVLAVGMSLGREGPTIQMGASIGKLVGDVSKVSRRGRTSLIAAGAGAGLAAAFNAPLAGFLFVMEELRREMSALTYGSALAASVCAVAVTRFVFGFHTSFELTIPRTPPLSLLPVVAGLGVICGFGGVLFNKGLLGALALRTHYRVPRWIYGAFVGLASGLSLILLPQITGSGHEVAEQLLSGKFASLHLAALLALLFFGKLFLTSASYGTGVPGGIFAPILALGALLGYLCGLGIHAAQPLIEFSDSGFATIGMAALLAASVRAPLTGVVLIVEMTGEYGLLYSLLVGAFVASLTAEALKDKPVYDALMERDLHLSGVEVHSSSEPLLLEVLIEPHSTMDGIRVKNLRLPLGAILTTIERDMRQIVPGGSTILRAGDMITVLIEGDKPELSLTVHESAKAP